ncbi:NADH:flavin oxidoreductase/NADH oxidase [Oharaeibacter diazotrophicus]|uniref:2,4-dienoyl-CoA reductase-like NADH-dependent reductase (Old Yellow Enzyme family) n=1 Tax=Oharaeibacter diazotrophicus TaxID=1920512 RepID=A0A4R6RKU3_9HYPH|nr:NADH:flavin oxidoreductase/NADH oxidase [Oharaeibacter diazotrophicus]TDP87114.1 2,4-dienoyl-CoA reductase-like NADH-dependent reductase (Old Yellow Enzyme family) [Oharaeibacter diazotrophicus]BBE70943.1 NADPH dehydrogenase [Pleomorphomonas sp. SM30]GLS77691.1 FMN oxidoreductase [Oharaeibacter diazotrophicus]
MTTLFSPLALRALILKNRVVVPPMCQYSARDGMANDWHFAHLARFGIGGFGLVIAEATAVVPEGRITYADLGLWSDAHVAPLARVVDFLHGQGAAAGIQLAHAGRKAATPLPWRGRFDETEAEKDAAGFVDWQPVAPSAVRHSDAPGFKTPRELSPDEIRALPGKFADAARRALAAGFDLVEIHAAHGYLLNQFLSPLANHRHDEWGGSLANRMRLPLAVVDAVRAAWPAERPLLVRISATDAHPDGWTVEDSVVFARELKARGVDVVHVSSGGFDGATIRPAPLYQLALSERIRAEAEIATVAVGLVTEPADAERIVASGAADLVALGRMALDDPNWPLHAALALGVPNAYGLWPTQAGYAVRNKDRSLKIRGFAAE